MKHTDRFFGECAGIRRSNPTFLAELRKDQEEYRDLLETLSGDELLVMQGRARELKKILNLLDEAERITGR